MPLSPFISARIKVASNRPLGHQAGTVALFRSNAAGDFNPST
jgi:hypothetical protein